MEQDRLSSLGILSIENELLKEISIDDIIDQFASKRDRRMQFF